MALFGAPLATPIFRTRGGSGAKMIRELNALNRMGCEGRPSLDIGIGISTGPMIAGKSGQRRS